MVLLFAQLTGPSYAIISDCRQPLVQRCNVCAVSFKSIEYHAEDWKALEISLWMLCLWNEGRHCLVKSQLPKADQGFKARWQKANRSFDQKAETFDIKLLPGNSAASLHCLASNWILMTGHKRYSLPIPLSSITGSHKRLCGGCWLIDIWKDTYVYLILANIMADS